MNAKCELFQKFENLKVMKCFQMFKEIFDESLKKMLLNVLNVTSNGNVTWMWNAYKGRLTTNTGCKLFQKFENLKVMKCFQMFKESFDESLKKMLLNVLNVTSNGICDMLVNHVMTFGMPIECISHGLCSRLYVLRYVA